jgi:hypothetical protein
MTCSVPLCNSARRCTASITPPWRGQAPFTHAARACEHATVFQSCSPTHVACAVADGVGQRLLAAATGVTPLQTLNTRSILAWHGRLSLTLATKRNLILSSRFQYPRYQSPFLRLHALTSVKWQVANQCTQWMRTPLDQTSAGVPIQHLESRFSCKCKLHIASCI